MAIKKTKKKKRTVIEKDGKFYTPRGIELTRNANTMTEAQYFAMILSALRGTTRFWKPCLMALEAASRPSQSTNKRLKKEYQCNHCKEWFKRKDVEIDHIIPCQGITSYDRIVTWLMLAHVEEGFQILCKPCHRIKTNEERKANVK